MADRTRRVVTFIVPGDDQTLRGATPGAPDSAPAELPIALPGAQVKQSVRVGTHREGGTRAVRVEATAGEDVVVLDIANGPALVLHPDHARDLMRAQASRPVTRSAVEGTASADEVDVPLELIWRGLEDAAPVGATRGALGRVLLKAVHVLTGDGAARLTATEVARLVDSQVDPGVYKLSRDALHQLKTAGVPPTKTIEKSAGPILVLIHGTFSTTHGTFGKLWGDHPELVTRLFDHYGDRVYALDHRTLGASPVENARVLADALPSNARVHLVTHSRGGLVAEVLARLSAAPALTQEQAALFKKNDTAIEELRALATVVKSKGIRVDRVVRVACPARGTLLASKRLDAYVSVLRWSLQLAGIPVAPQILEFLHAVARQREKPDVLPGLAAQIPDSPLIQWLHAADAPIPGDLRVVAGDLQGDSITSWLKTLLADSFYWTDNDLVVQTRSMYGGSARQEAAFVLDQGGKVSHFNYFHNDRTAEAIVDALVENEPAGFRAIGPLSYAGESSSGVRAAILAAADERPGRDKPALFLLPGILGSNLKVDGRRIWLGWGVINGLERLTYGPHGGAVEPDGPVDRVYDDIGRFLAATHEVIEFGYDWRKPIEQEAVRLADRVSKALDARAETGQPVRILAHSMGGVLARTMLLERPKVWDRMMAQPGARMLMLGTPNGGSWAPMQVLSGDDSFGNLLALVGAPFRTAAARQLMAEFPGFLQLQAGLLDAERKLSLSETWKALAEEDRRRLAERSWWHSEPLQLDSYTWGVPSQQVLEQAAHLRRRLDEQREKDLPKYRDRLLLVTGKARYTPDGYVFGDKGLTYLDAEDFGDGRVTLSAAQLPGVSTWQVDCVHGDLASHRDAFDGYLDLLQQGTTYRLKTVLPATRGATAAEPGEVIRVPSRPSRGRSSAKPPEGPNDLLRPAPAAPLDEGVERDPALRITVHNGDLSFVREPLMLGHYRSSSLTGTERVMDRLIGRTMTRALDARLYPDAPGSYQVFINARLPENSLYQLPRPEGVIVVGLGPEGKLNSPHLMETVRQGVLAWAQRLAERQGARTPLFDLAATLIGSGGKGVEVGQAARFIARGVREANRQLRAMRTKDDGDAGRPTWPSVGHLHLIELYLDRAAEALRELKIEASAATSFYDVTPTIKTDAGALIRPIDAGYRGSDYDFMSAVPRAADTTEGVIEYTLDTRRARTELRDQITQKSLVRSLVATASNAKSSDPRLGVTLCRLLIPLKLDAFLAGTTELLIELDDGTAGIPWELLDTGAADGEDSRPWSIRSKLVRRLRTRDSRDDVIDVDVEARALVIGEPMIDSNTYPPLPGAREEAAAVARLLAEPGALGNERVKRLVGEPGAGPPAAEVINSLLERRRSGKAGQGWRIVHVAGHGEPPLAGNPRGVVLSDGLFLGPREVESMREVPELVFVNCCHVGASDPAQVLAQGARGLGQGYNRVDFAAGLARKLIDIGVRCVVVAGWAVDDAAANTFATTFYQALLAGHRFMDAVGAAREAAYRPDDKTWAAYQCYGDPDWTLRLHPGDDRPTSRSPTSELSSVTSAVGLSLALHTLMVQSQSRTPGDDQLTRLRHLEYQFGGTWGGLGYVAAAFGDAWKAVGNRAKAVEWYRKALKANDGTASIRAAEQLGNVLARQAWETVEQAWRKADTLQHSRRVKDQPPKAKSRRRQVGTDPELQNALSTLREAAIKAQDPLKDAIRLLERVADLERTMEREGLLGSAYKRQALIAGALGDQEERLKALKQMRAHYQRALDEGRRSQLGGLFYPGLNLMAADLLLRDDKWKGFDAATVADVERSLEQQMREDPEFWAAAGNPELLLYKSIAADNLAAEAQRVLALYEDLRQRVTAPWLWASVYDQVALVLSVYARKAGEKERDEALRVLQAVHEYARGADDRNS